MTNAESAGTAPLVSVVVACRNEARRIGRMTRGLLSSSYPRERLEVIFADAMSTDGTRQALERLRARHPFMTVVLNPRIVTPAGLNIGIRAAHGEIIVRMDAHAEYPPDYISRCVRLLLSDPRIGSAGGRSVNLPGGEGRWALAAAYVTGHRFGVGNVAYVTSRRPGPVDTVAFGAFRRAVLDEVGLYDERLTRNQDNELHARLQKAGYLIAYDPDIVSYYRNRSTLGGLARQAYVTGKWNVYTLLLHPYTWKARRFVPMAFLLYLAALAFALAARSRWTAAAGAPLALYAALIASCSRGRGAAAAGRWRVAATFFSYHLAYGAGPLAGLLHLATGRWRSQLGRPLAGRAP